MKTLRAFCPLCLIIGCICSAFCLSYAADLQGESLESKLEQLKTTVYCYCGCTRETIKHCVCGTATDIETEFRERLIAGEAVEQIRDDYLKEYGSQYSAVLPVRGFNILAYVMPGIILILLGGVILFILMLKSKTPTESKIATKPASVTEKNRAVSEERAKEIEVEVQRHTQQR